MGSQVSQRQKKDLAKYYTSLLGQKEQHSVNAYMQISSENPSAPTTHKKKRRYKKKRALSHAAHPQQPHGTESQSNILTIEQDAEPREQYGYAARTESGVDEEHDNMAMEPSRNLDNQRMALTTNNEPAESMQSAKPSQQQRAAAMIETQSDKPNEGK